MENEEKKELAVAAQQKAFIPITDGKLAPKDFDGLYRVAVAIARSGLAPKEMAHKPEAVFVACSLGLEIGLSIMASIQNISAINGRPSIWGDAALALVLSSRQCEMFKEEYKGEYPQDTFKAVCSTKRKDVSGETVNEFSIGDAKRAGLWNKQGPWTQYPKRMLKMRARSFTIRDAYADILKGLALTEEVQDYAVDLMQGPNQVYAPAKDKEEAPKDLYNVTRKAPEAPTDTGQPEDDKGGETPSDAANTTTADPAGPLPGQGDFEDEKLENRNTNPLPDSGVNKSYPWDSWNPLDSPRQKRYSATLKGIMLAFLAHHGIDANPHDTGLQLHDQIIKKFGPDQILKKLGHDQDNEPEPEPEPEEKQEPETYAQMPEAQIKMVERMNELIISGNASAKSYAAQMLNLGTRRPTPDEAEAWLACYDDAMADLQQKSEGKDPFNDQF
jgi:hypothetical protein